MFKRLLNLAGYISENGVRSAIRQMRLSNELRFGELKGVDQFGNKYYESAKSIPGRHRWVVSVDYRDFNASNVPAEWHSWLHYISDAPAESDQIKYKLKHQPTVTSNLGNNANYLPPHHWINGSKAEQPKTTNYESWTPNSPPPSPDEPSRLDQK